MELASEARAFLLPVWAEWQAARGLSPEVLSARTCVRSSLFLSRVLQSEGLDAAWVNNVPRLSEEGPELGPFGYFTGVRWEAHAWVICEDWIVDITADQFGGEAVTVTKPDNPLYGFSGIDTVPEATRLRREIEIAVVWQRWLDRI